MSSVSRDEMQTKRPFGEKDMDYKILLLVYRDRSNHSAVWYPALGCAQCYCMLFTLKNMRWLWSTFFVTSFKELTLIFWCCNPRRAFTIHCRLCSILQEIVCVSGYGSQWHHETLLPASMHEYQLHLISNFTTNRTKIMHDCCFNNFKQFFVQLF